MEYRRFGNKIVARIDKGEELVEKLCEIAERESIRFATVNGWGSSRNVSLIYYDTKRECEYGNVYNRIDQELTNISGAIVRDGGEARMELRAVIGNPSHDSPMSITSFRFGFAVAGRLKSAVISTTCTVILELIDLDVHLTRPSELGYDVMEFGS